MPPEMESSKYPPPPPLTLRFDYGHEFGSLPFTKNSRNSSWKINGTHCFGIFQWKFFGKSGKSEIFILKFEMEVPENVYTIYMFLGTSQNLSWRGGGVWKRNEIFQNKISGPPLRVKIFLRAPLFPQW